MPDPSPCRLVLLDEPRLAVDDAAPPRPLGAHDAALLAWLVLEGAVARDRIAALLWPGADRRAAANSLRQRLHRLRAGAANPPIAVDTLSLALAPGVTHDLQLPHDRLRADPRDVGADLLGHLGYPEGTPLATWVDRQRRRWRQVVLDALLAVGGEAELDDRPEQARVLAQRAVALAPCDQAATRLLMRVLLHLGERALAQAEFARVTEALRADGDRTPDEATLDLARHVGRSGAAALAEAAQLLPLALRRPPRTVGRDALRERALERWTTDGVVLLTGPPGIGKTRLLDDLAQATGAALRLQPAQVDAEQPHGVAGVLVERLLRRRAAALADDDLDALHALAGRSDRQPPAGERRPETLAAQVQRLLAALPQDEPLTIVVDDLQFADEPSLDVLVRLWPRRARPAPPPVRWLLAMRDAPCPEPVADWLEALDARLEPRLPVPPIAAEDVGALMRAVCAAPVDTAAWGARLHRHCGGHPLYVLQVLRELGHRGEQLGNHPPDELPVPAQTLERVARRLDGVDETTRRLATLAALLDGELDAALLQRLLGCEAPRLVTAWRRLQALHVLDERRFSHELVRQAVLDAIPAPLAPLLHREIAEALTAAAPARRARHWEAAGEPARAADARERAADEALAHGLTAEAARQLGHAQRLHEATGRPAAVRHAAWRRGHLLVRTRPDEARAIGEHLSAQLDGADATQRARAFELLAFAKAEQFDATARADARAASRLAREAGDAALRALARLALAQATAELGRYARSARILSLLRRDHALLDPAAQEQADELHAITLAHLGRRRAACALHQERLDLASRQGRWFAAYAAAGNAAVCLSYMDEQRAARTMYERAVALAHRAGIEGGAVLIDEIGLAGAENDEGRFADGLARLARCARELRESGHLGWSLIAENDMAAVLLLFGQPQQARALLRELPADAPTWTLAARHVARARIARATGGSGKPAVDAARRLLMTGGAIGTPYAEQKIALEQARHDSPTAAAAHAPQTQRWAEQHEHTALAFYARFVQLEALNALGQRADAAAAADALAPRMRPGEPVFALYRPEIWLAQCVAWAAAGRADEAAALAQQGARWIRETAATRVPAAYRASFIAENAVNRRLLDWRTGRS